MDHPQASRALTGYAFLMLSQNCRSDDSFDGDIDDVQRCLKGISSYIFSVSSPLPFQAEPLFRRDLSSRPVLVWLLKCYALAAFACLEAKNTSIFVNREDLVEEKVKSWIIWLFVAGL